MNFEAVSYLSAFLLFLEAYCGWEQSSQRRRCPESGSPRIRIGPVLWAWPTGEPQYLLEVLSFSCAQWGLACLVHKNTAPHRTRDMRTSENSVQAKFIREAHSPSPHGPEPPDTTLDHK
jgi:hypothetical protein